MQPGIIPSNNIAVRLSDIQRKKWTFTYCHHKDLVSCELPNCTTIVVHVRNSDLATFFKIKIFNTRAGYIQIAL